MADHRKKTFHRFLFVLADVCLIVVFWYLVRYCFLPMRSYHEAERLVGENEYEQAAGLFSSVAEKYQLTPGTLNGTLAKLGGFADAAERVSQTRYGEGEYLRTNGDYEQAVQIFTDLGGYQDSADQVKNTKLLQASALADENQFDEAISILEGLGSYDGGDYGNAQKLLDQTRYTLAGKLTDIGKMDEAEELYNGTETFEDSYEKLRDLRYNMARNALLVSDFAVAKTLLQKVGDYRDSRDILAILDSAVDKVYQTDLTDVRGASTPAVQSYIWMHSVIVPGKLDEGISVKMQEDIVTGGVVTAGLFGAGSYDYNLEQVRDADTWYFNYYGSDTENADGAVVLEAQFNKDYSTMTTKKVFVSVRNAEEAEEAAGASGDSSDDSDSGSSGGGAKVAEAEDDTSDESSDQEEEGDPESKAKKSSTDGGKSDDGKASADHSSKGESSDQKSSGSESAENESPKSKTELPRLEHDETRNWSEVSDTKTADQIREGFRTRKKIQLAENGNLYYCSSTDDDRLPHYCSVAHCLNTGKYKAEDFRGRRYYCEEHYGNYTNDPAYSADTDESIGEAEE